MAFNQSNESSSSLCYLAFHHILPMNDKSHRVFLGLFSFGNSWRLWSELRRLVALILFAQRDKSISIFHWLVARRVLSGCAESFVCLDWKFIIPSWRRRRCWKSCNPFFIWTYLSISSISDYNECESGGICHNTTITGAPMRWREKAKEKQPRQQKIFPAKANNHTQLVVSFLAAEIVLLSFLPYTVVNGRVASSINWTTQHTTQQHNIKLFRVQHSSNRTT